MNYCLYTYIVRTRTTQLYKHIAIYYSECARFHCPEKIVHIVNTHYCYIHEHNGLK